MLTKFRKSRLAKGMAVWVVFNLLGQIFIPTISLAITPGPIDINQTSFEPASTSEMVNLATGDFTYNIPLLDVDGYPINIAYHAGVGMDQEASMVGLGWSLNVGAINRIKKGLPDDFNGDEIETTMSMRPYFSSGVNGGLSGELIGFDPNVFNVNTGDSTAGSVSLSGNFGFGVGFDNYQGFSSEVFGGASLNASIGFIQGSLGQSISSNSQDGLTVTQSVGASIGIPGTGLKIGVGVGNSSNTLTGAGNKSVSASLGGAQEFSSSKASFMMGIGTTAIIPQSTVSYTPSIQFETNTISRNFDFSAGGSLCYLDFEGRFTAFKSMTCIKESTESIPAFGYMNQENHLNTNEFLMDYNKEGVVQNNKHIHNLPVTNHTYDLFLATAQGVGFSFRPHRSEVGIVGEMERQNTINGIGVSGEVGFGNVFQAGININTPGGIIQSGKWDSDNAIVSDMEFKINAPTGSDANLYENSFFKKFGNRSTSSLDQYNQLGGDLAVKQLLSKEGGTQDGLLVGETSFVDSEGVEHFKSTDNVHYKTEREQRNTNIQYLSALEATNYAVRDDIEIYSLSDYNYDNGNYTKITESRFGSGVNNAKKHHLSEMSTLKGDGSRYVYGIPVLNQKTEEVTFNVSDESSDNAGPLTKDCNAGLITYTTNDNSTNNTRGANNLYLKRTTPAYATSYLLTEYLSSNYIDRTGDGPTPDDYGGYTKFNYAKVGTAKWRFPFEEDQAFYNESLKSNSYDDMGSYVYGERDQWYIHSIETKNFVAEFHYTDRYDAYGVSNEDGGIAPSNTSKKLSVIKLYSREGKENGEAPIKSVHFEYDYSLCSGVPNNINTENQTGSDDGKLTLKSIYFTYGSSERGKLHKYEFDYATGDQNPDYSHGSADRWGTYKEIAVGATCDETGGLSNIEYPYSVQNQQVADNNAGAWSLETIHLPSGSEIHIELESDDYEYVQNKEATRMFKVKGFSNTTEFVENDKEILYEKLGQIQILGHNYLHIELNDLGTNALDAKSYFFQNYATNNHLYIRSLVKLTSAASLNYDLVPGTEYDYVSAYLEFDEENSIAYDNDSDGQFETIALKLKDTAIDDDHNEITSNSEILNPLSKASFQFIRKYAPHVMNPIVGSIYDKDDNISCGNVGDIPDNTQDDDIDAYDENEDDNQFFQNLLNTGQSHLQNLVAAGGINFMLSQFLYASECVTEKTWVRLKEVEGSKFGGGHRVKQIVVNDNWNSVTNGDEATSTYGTKYSYTLLDSSEISSGVASYEPITSGGDENAMREPLHYSIDIKMRVNDEEFQEMPFGESIFANPSVVYSEIKVENIDYTNVTQNGTGKTVYYYYTAKDFPVIFDHTGKASASALESTNGWMSLFTMESYTNLAMSQGYSIHLNDMHGKFKGKKIFAEEIGQSNQAIYEMKHEYFVDEDDPFQLNNLVSTVDENGVISDEYMGRDVDMVVDLVETSSIYHSSNSDLGISVASCFLPAPIAIPSVWSSGFSNQNQFRSSVTTKVITSSGILKKVVLLDKGRYKESTNILFDKGTGVPVMTEITYEQPTNPPSSYENKIYQYDYPAHWIYDGMGMASENWGAQFDNIVNTSTGAITLSNMSNYLVPGDELSVYDLTDGEFDDKVWVIDNESTAGLDDLFVVDINGNTPSYLESGHAYRYKVIRSGRRNLLGSTAASVTSMNNDILGTSFASVQSEVLNASAVEYTQEALGYSSTKTTTDPTELCGLKAGEVVNPYVRGLLGNWNLLTSYVYDYTRNQSNGNVREDGLLTAYTQFWKYSSGEWQKNTSAEAQERWIQAAIATIFDPEGYNLESKDALGIHSSILLGYNNTLKIAEAVNARYYEIGFDGFEDRDYDQTGNCSQAHFRITDGEVTNEEAHTGRHSMKVVTKEGGAVYTADVVNSIDQQVTNHGKPYTVQEQQLIKPHTIIASTSEAQKYVLTAWVKQDVLGSNEVHSYDGATIDVELSGNPISNIVESRSNIINGWQRIEIVFEIPAMVASSDYLTLEFWNTGGSATYYDDIRIQPYNSEMVSYVIDPVSLRLWATLDSKNFATFYQYDEEGSLVRIIQETEKGRFTVQENRAGISIQ